MASFKKDQEWCDMNFLLTEENEGSSYYKDFLNKSTGEEFIAKNSGRLLAKSIDFSGRKIAMKLNLKGSDSVLMSFVKNSEQKTVGVLQKSCNKRISNAMGSTKYYDYSKMQTIVPVMILIVDLEKERYMVANQNIYYTFRDYHGQKMDHYEPGTRVLCKYPFEEDGRYKMYIYEGHFYDSRMTVYLSRDERKEARIEIATEKVLQQHASDYRPTQKLVDLEKEVRKIERSIYTYSIQSTFEQMTGKPLDTFFYREMIDHVGNVTIESLRLSPNAILHDFSFADIFKRDPKRAKPIILLDMDGVVANMDAFFAEMCEKEGIKCPAATRDRYYLNPFMGLDAVEKIFKTDDFFNKLAVVDGAVEAYKQLNEQGWDIRFLTSPPPNIPGTNCASQKIHWIERNFGKKAAENVVIAIDKTIFQGEILVDDKPKISGVSEPTWKHWLFDTLCNQTVDHPRRVNWKTVPILCRPIINRWNLFKSREAEKKRDEEEMRELEMNPSCDGSLAWRIKDFSRKKEDARKGLCDHLYSVPFYTSPKGYKMQLKVYPNGDGMGKGSHLSVFFVLMKGKYDDKLSWPFNQKVTFYVEKQVSIATPAIQPEALPPGHVESGGRYMSRKRAESLLPMSTVSDTFKPDPQSSSFQQPKFERNIATGSPLIMRFEHLMNPVLGFIVDDEIVISVEVDKKGLAPDPIDDSDDDGNDFEDDDEDGDDDDSDRRTDDEEEKEDNDFDDGVNENGMRIEDQEEAEARGAYDPLSNVTFYSTDGPMEGDVAELPREPMEGDEAPGSPASPAETVLEGDQGEEDVMDSQDCEEDEEEKKREEAERKRKKDECPNDIYWVGSIVRDEQGFGQWVESKSWKPTNCTCGQCGRRPEEKCDACGKNIKDCID